ncbi:MAG TPA: class III extradiol ring-cleavage dioxygenase [Gammaproteobacteria bacterium]|nr:class III extradiol ring-cleavage dioxygenase [Gammaproteobacteria bacterium]
MTINTTLPSLFVPHGAPTFALRPGAAGAALARQAAALPRPRAVVAVSAHWETARPTVGTAPRLDTVHDFRGFPEALYRIRYPATGCPEAARAVGRAIEAAGLPVDFDAERGLDHGAWVPLRMMFPAADVPIVPLSLQPDAGPAHALRVGRALAPLRREGLMVIASGNLTHNLRDYFEAGPDRAEPPAYVRLFADWMHQRLVAGDTAALLDYRRQAPDARRAHPSEEHLLPLFVALGAAGEPFETLRFHAGIDDAVLAMDAFAFTARHDAVH